MARTENELAPSSGWSQELLFRLWLLDAGRKWRWIQPFIPPHASILEIGSGPGSVYHLASSLRHPTTAIDVVDRSLRPGLSPMIYPGRRMPFADRHFDVGLLLTVLHHARDPDGLLAEARRVARRLIVIEDVYRNRLQRRLTLAADSLFNFEFSGHPHNNRSDDGWRATFAHQGLRLEHACVRRLFAVFLQATYVLCTDDTPS